MQPFRSTVYIPLVELTNQTNQLLNVYAETQLFGETVLDEKSLDKNWNFVAAPLKDASLYSDGLQVVSAIRKLGLKAPFWAVYQHVKKYAWLDNQRLYSGNHILDNCEGNSAQLGLAVALLLNASNSPIRYALATGKLSGDKHADYDVAIEAVGSIPEKLDLLIEKRNLLPPGKLYCFTPTHYKIEAQLSPVVELPQIKVLAGLDIEVKPIAWLSEAARILQADRTRYLKQDKRLNLIAATVASLVLGTFLYLSWWHYPIPIKLIAGKQNPEPFLVCTNRDLTEVSYHDLQRDGNIPLLPVFDKENINYNVSLGWRMFVAKTPLTRHYYVAYIHLGQKTGLKIANKAEGNVDSITVAGDELLEWDWPMEEKLSKEQDNVLILALQRTPIDVDSLNRRFHARFSVEKEVDLLAARDFLLKEFPATYHFNYRSVFTQPPCIKNSS